MQGGYLGFAIAFVVMTAARSILNLYSAWGASRAIHASSLHRLVGTFVLFFDTTPIGRVLNRFSKVRRSETSENSNLQSDLGSPLAICLRSEQVAQRQDHRHALLVSAQQQCWCCLPQRDIKRNCRMHSALKNSALRCFRYKAQDTDDMDYLLPQSVTELGNCIMQLLSTMVRSAPYLPCLLL